MLFPVVGSRVSSIKIPHSVRFYPADTPELSRTLSIAGNRKIFTISWWMKVTDFGTLRPLFHSNIFSGAYFGVNLNSSDQFEVRDGSTFTTTYTGATFRDPTAHLHCVLAVNTNNGNSTKFRLYVNNVELTNGGTYPGVVDLAWNHNGGSTLAMYIGKAYTGSERFGGYLSQIHHIDGQQLTPASFGELNGTTGVWSPRPYSGSYGTNGFFLDFSDDTLATSSALGKDRSGNNNDWTPTNLSVGTSGYDVDRDVYTDSPSVYSDGGNGRGNFCILNSLDSSEGLGSPQLKNGGLELHYQSAGWQEVRGTIAVTSGKWYWEVTVAAVGSGGSFAVGIRSALGKNTGGVWWHSGSWSSPTNGLNYGYKDDAQKTTSGSQSAYGASFTTGDVLSIALDLDAGTLVFYKNGTSQGSAFTGLAGLFTPGISLNVGAHAKVNFGQRAFKHTPPANHLALSTLNLPAPAVVRGSTAFDAVTYAGTGASNSISSLGFSPDLVWIKQRSSPADGHHLYDLVRGVTQKIGTDSTAAEAAVAQGLTTFAASGFTVGTDGGVNENTLNYVAWCWNEAVASGLDIVSFTGTGASQAISHNLGKTPEFILYKSRSASGSWVVGHRYLNLGTTPWNYQLAMTTAAQAASSAPWNNTAPTSTQFTVGSAAANTVTQIAYVFTSIAGFSEFGFYVGSGTSNGPFVYCGFRPRFILIKAASSSGDWKIHDTARDTVNPAGNDLIADTTTAEAVGSGIMDITANGFKLRGTSSNYNGTGVTYIFAAFAEHPLTYARAR